MITEENKLAKILKDWGEPFTKILSLLAIFLYATGLFLSGCYYSHRGVPAFSFVQPAYVLTGFWFWLPFLIFFACQKVFKSIKTNKNSGTAVLGMIFCSVFFLPFILL